MYNNGYEHANFHAYLQDRTVDVHTGRGLGGEGKHRKVRNSVYLYYYYYYKNTIQVQQKEQDVLRIRSLMYPKHLVGLYDSVFEVYDVVS
jgi:hypothetical protein